MHEIYKICGSLSSVYKHYSPKCINFPFSSRYFWALIRYTKCVSCNRHVTVTLYFVPFVYVTTMSVTQGT
jgi:hypothetical protein